MEQVIRYVDDATAALQKEVIRRFSYVGERCIIQAREHGSYKDQTGNLRSSIGYIIVCNGQIVDKSGFWQVKQDSKKGSSLGKSFSASLASKFPEGVVLIVVAGMDYAAYVEAKGYDVITSSEILAERIVPELLANLGFKRK